VHQAAKYAITQEKIIYDLRIFIEQNLKPCFEVINKMNAELMAKQEEENIRLCRKNDYVEFEIDGNEEAAIHALKRQESENHDTTLYTRVREERDLLLAENEVLKAEREC
jgi:hypothetical protein